MKSNNSYGKSYSDYLINVGTFRKFLRSFYLRDIANLTLGKTLDFGCGSGELLEYLSNGSEGYEINKYLVDYAFKLGKKIKFYNLSDDYRFSNVDAGDFQSLTINHVLEHLDRPELVLKKLLATCYKKGIVRVVVTVPGTKGFKHDKTHKTFVDMKYLVKNNLISCNGFKIVLSKYYPINVSAAQLFITHNELRIVYDRIS